MKKIFASERIFSGYPQGRADSWITIWHMLLWLSKERGRAVQPHGSNCESWCYLGRDLGNDGEEGVTSEIDKCAECDSDDKQLP